MGTMGTGPSVYGEPFALHERAHALPRWSGWMSNSTRLGRAGPPVMRSVRSRLCCTRKSVPRRKAPKPMASTTVGLVRRPVQVGDPCRHTYGQPAGSQRSAARMSAHEAPQSTSSATATPAENRPWCQLPTCSAGEHDAWSRERRAPRPAATRRAAAAVGLDVPPERRQRRHPADGEQRQQREDERDPEPHAEPERHGARRATADVAPAAVRPGGPGGATAPTPMTAPACCRRDPSPPPAAGTPRRLGRRWPRGSGARRWCRASGG